MAKAVTLKNNNNEEVYPVTDISLVNGELNGARIVNASVGSDKLTPNAVWNENIKDRAVASAKIDWSTFGNKWVYMTSTVSIGTSTTTVMSITCSTPGTFLVIGTVDPNLLNINPGNFMCGISVNGNIKQSVYANSSGGWFMGGMTVQTIEQLKNGDVVRLVSSTAQNTVQIGRGHMAIIRVG